MSKTITMEPLKIIFASIALMISLCMMPQTLVAEENFPVPMIKRERNSRPAMIKGRTGIELT